MVLEKDEYRIEGDGIWLSKKALEECRNHYCKVADKFKPKPKKQDFDFRFPFYIGKADVCIDLLKHFEPLIKAKRMKSIKEKAEEYAKEFIEPFVLYYSQDEVKQFEAQHEDSFEECANYVLDEIEKSLQEFSNYEDSLIISRIIEQLKK